MNDLLDEQLFRLGNYSIKIHNVLVLMVLILAVGFILFILKKIVFRSKKLDEAKKFSLYKLAQYFIIFLAFLSSLSILRIDITLLLAGSTALLVGLGFGLQNLFNDFISGLILLFDRSIRVGDNIEVNGFIYKVVVINFRTTTVIGRNDDYVLLPNSELTRNRIINWTYGHVSSRFKIGLGVDYSTDIDLLTEVVIDVVSQNTHILKDPKPFIRFEDFGDSALLFGIYFFSDEVFRVEKIKSDIRFELYRALKSKGIHIPFPQRVVHMQT